MKAGNYGCKWVRRDMKGVKGHKRVSVDVLADSWAEVDG